MMLFSPCFTGTPLSFVDVHTLPRLGCIYDPFRDELFTATRGNGAFLNGLQMTVGDQVSISKG